MPTLSVMQKYMYETLQNNHYCDSIKEMATTLKALKLRIKDKHASVLGQLAREVNVGDIFGRLTITARVDHRAIWRCDCICGGEKNVKSSKLLSGHTSSCGCAKRDGGHLSRMTEAAANVNKKPISGQRFGKLMVLSDNDNTYITAQCDCGNIDSFRRNSVVQGYTKSCGCLQSERAKVLALDLAKRRRRSAGMPEDAPMSPQSLLLRNKFKDVSSQVKRLDNYTCALCQQRGVRLNTHHIERWSDKPSLRFDLMNLVTLCRDCHIDKAHGGNVHQEPSAPIAALLKNYVLNRQWTCSCGAEHDRDVNAARNIARRGMATLEVGASA